MSIGRVARGVVRDRLDQWGFSDEVAYRVMTVATELASNALLHASPPYLLRLSTNERAVRVSVRDSLALTPTVREYGALALTGRGLRLVADSCTSWGVKNSLGGKEVWAEVPYINEPQLQPAMQTAGFAGPGPRTRRMESVRFLAVPVDTYLSLQQWNDAVVRECELIAALDPSTTHVPPRLLELAVHLSGRFAAEREGYRDVMGQARAEGSRTVDLDGHFPAPVEASLKAAESFLTIMEEIDGFCRRHILLSEAPAEMVVRLRRWFVTESRAQLLEHAAPSPFDPVVEEQV